MMDRVLGERCQTETAMYPSSCAVEPSGHFTAIMRLVSDTRGKDEQAPPSATGAHTDHALCLIRAGKGGPQGYT